MPNRESKYFSIKRNKAEQTLIRIKLKKHKYMCMPNFIENQIIPIENSIIGYRSWRLKINNSILKSLHQEFIWTPESIQTPHIITESDSGIYAYNYNYHNNYYNYYYNNNNYNNNYDNNYYHYDNYYNNNYNYYYTIGGVISQYGTIAFHKTGQRSEYAKIKTLFTIQESNASGSDKFIEWVPKFNNQIKLIAEQFGADTIYWQDFNEDKNK